MSETILSIDTFWEQFAGQPYELVSGRLVSLHATDSTASEIAIAAAAELYNFTRKARCGRVTGANGAYALSSNCVRVPDVGVFTGAKAARITDAHKYLPFPPDLAVEVVGPDESAGELMEKVNQYLTAGTSRVWVIYPEQRIVVVHYPNFSARTFTAAGVLDGGSILPGLQLAVSDLFPIGDSL